MYTIRKEYGFFHNFFHIKSLEHCAPEKGRAFFGPWPLGMSTFRFFCERTFRGFFVP